MAALLLVAMFVMMAAFVIAQNVERSRGWILTGWRASQSAWRSSSSIPEIRFPGYPPEQKKPASAYSI
jgi:hypothetical protein